MVKTKFKKAVSLMLAAVMSLTAFMGIGATTAFAAVGEKADVYLVDYPRSGDTNNNGEWGHGNMSFSKGFGMEISPPLPCNSPTSPLPPDLTKSPIISPQHFFDFRLINRDKLVILFKDTFKFLLLLLSFLCVLKNILHRVRIL